MPTSAEAALFLVDTSVAVPLVAADHVHHEAVLAAVEGRRLGLAGHAAFETFSVLTRLPAPARRTPPTVGRLLSTSFPDTRFLSPERTRVLLAEMGDRGLAGGSVYDALVACAAVEHGARLLSRDQRALSIYRQLNVDVELLS